MVHGTALTSCPQGLLLIYFFFWSKNWGFSENDFYDRWTISLFLQWCFVGRNTKYDVKYDVIASSLKLSLYNRCYLHNRC